MVRFKWPSPTTTALTLATLVDCLFFVDFIYQRCTTTIKPDDIEVALVSWTPNFRHGFEPLSLEDDGTAAINKRELQSADLKANSHQTIKKPESAIPPYPHP